MKRDIESTIVTDNYCINYDDNVKSVKENKYKTFALFSHLLTLGPVAKLELTPCPGISR